METFFNNDNFIKTLYNPEQKIYRYVEGGYEVVLPYHNYVNFYQVPTNHLHLHDAYEICLVMAGHGLFEHDGISYRLSPGCLFIADPKVLHEITSYDSGDLYLFFFGLTIEERQLNSGDAGVVKRFETSHKIMVTDCHDLFHYLPLIDRQVKNASNSEQLANELVHSMVMDILDRMSSDVTVSVPESISTSDVVIKVESYVEEHMTEKITVNDLALLCNMSSRHLRRIIRAHYNQTVVQWLNDKKLHKACILLGQKSSVAEAAEQTGFLDVNYFSVVFKKKYGIMPSRYKK